MNPSRGLVTTYLAVTSLVALSAMAFGFGFLYRLNLSHQKGHLMALVSTYSRLVENQMKHGVPTDQDLVAFFSAAPVAFPVSGLAHELVLGRREGGSIRFLYRQRAPRPTEQALVEWASPFGEPMRRALNGSFGVVEAKDYRDVQVLGAHAPLFGNRWGLVVKIDEKDIWGQYWRAAALAFAATIAALILGSLWVRHVSKPWFIAVSDNERKYRTLFEKAQEAILLYGLDAKGNPGVFMEVNESACRMTGYTRQELMGMRPVDLVPGNVAEPLRERARRVLRTGQLRFETTILRKDGGEAPWEVEAYAIHLFNRIILVAVGRDMVERKAAEKRIGELVAQLQESNERLVKLDRLKDDFLSTVSHELRTPLTSILGYLKLLTREVGGKLTDQQQDFLGVSLRNGERLYDLINELLDISRLESGKMELRLANTSLSRLMQEAMEATRNLFAIRRIELKAVLPPDDLSQELDEEKIFRVMVNLLGNASKFTPLNGHVEAGLRQHRLEGQEGILFWVKDDGSGIPPEDLRRIFDKFFRLGRHLDRETGGSGLGLAICQKLVELHGGSIWAENNSDRGATFYVFLPAVKTSSGPEGNRA